MEWKQCFEWRRFECQFDVNHDGISDLIIGSPFASPNNKTQAGTTTVIFGRKGEIDTLTDINGTNGFKLLGVNSGDWSGYSVSSARDVNSDGIQDFIIGAPYWKKKRTAQSHMFQLLELEGVMLCLEKKEEDGQQ